MTVEELPYWLVNVPRASWPSNCPDFLVNANAKDQRILSTPDEQYHRQTWPEVKQIISKLATTAWTMFQLTIVRD